jgi:predicted Rossmann fold nucleotide-binding protein DprA/Smf involved in DNA uptake
LTVSLIIVSGSIHNFSKGGTRMKELNDFLGAIAEGLGAMADGINVIAKKFEELSKSQVPEKSDKPKRSTEKKAVASSRKAPKKVKQKGTKSLPATDKVLEAIKGSNDGVDNQTIIKQTGLNQKQVSSALLRLKKYGKIKSVKRGVHTAV